MEDKIDKTTKQYKIQCKPNPFRASYEKNTKVTNTDVACSSKWTKIDLHQPGVTKQKITVANISQNGNSLFIRYNPELSKASFGGLHNIQVPLKKETVDDPDQYCVSWLISNLLKIRLDISFRSKLERIHLLVLCLGRYDDSRIWHRKPITGSIATSCNVL